MARRADSQAVQKAKGNPGRRKSAVAKREADIARIADILANAPADPADPLAPPALIDRGPLFAAAIACWRMMAPKLAETHRLQAQHRPLFAMFCVYYAEWLEANEDIKTNGLTQSVKTVAGGQMERIRPVVKIREMAFGQVLALASRFGLTPVDEYDLFRKQQAAAFLNPGLFSGQDQQQRGDRAADGEAPPAEQTGSLIGSMKRLDSPPPTTH